MAQVTFSSSVGGDGSTVSDDKNPTTGLDDGGHRTRFVPALSQVVAVAANTVASANAAATSALNAANAPNVSATSTTNLTIGIGNKTLTVQTGKAFVVGMSVKIAETITPTNWMHGTVTAYNSSTGSLTVSVDNISGISTATGWTISGSAPSFLGISEHLPLSDPSLNLDFANSKQLDTRIDFTRATTATRTNSKRLIELVGQNEPRIDYDPVTGECLGLLIEEQRTNLLTYSEEFDNAAWAKENIGIIPNYDISPDGSRTACLLYPTTDSNNFRSLRSLLDHSISSGSACLSIYVKHVSGIKTCHMYAYDSTETISTIKISLDGNGSILTETNATGGIVDVGNGWFRIYMISPNGLSNLQQKFLWLDYTNLSLDDQVLVWGAQLEAGAFPTSYVPSNTTFTSRTSTGTYTGSDGLIKSAAIDEARWNYNPLNLSVAPKLLLEPQRTNLLTYSEEFDNAAWTKTRASITANATTAPDGTLTADKLVEDSTASNSHVISKNINATTAQLFSSYIYAKASERSQIQLTVWNASASSNNVSAKFDLSTGIVLSTATSGNGSLVSGTIESVGNGWYKCTVSGQPDTSGTSVGVGVYLMDNISVVYNGDGTSGIYIWGAQLEEGSFPTSYIPTDSVAITRSADISASVAATRNADQAVMTGTNFSDWYRQDEGSVVIGSKLLGSSVSQELVSISNGTNSNYLALRWASSSQAQYTVLTSAVQIASIAPAGYSSIDVLYNRAFVYKNDDFAQIINGVNTGTDTSGSVPTVDKMYIGNNQTGNGKYNGHIKSLSYYPTRLSNTELQALTS